MPKYNFLRCPHFIRANNHAFGSSARVSPVFANSSEHKTHVTAYFDEHGSSVILGIDHTGNAISVPDTSTMAAELGEHMRRTGEHGVQRYAVEFLV